MIAQPFHVA